MTGKLAKKTLFYVMVSGVAMTMIIPMYFLISLSFLSGREAYSFPIPLVPSFSNELKLESSTGEKVLVSVWDKVEKKFKSVGNSSSVGKLERTLEKNLALSIDEESFKEKFEEVKKTKQPVEFKARKDIFANYKTFFRVTRNVGPAIINSLKVVGLTILISLSIGGMAGYALARYVFKGKDFAKISVLFVRMFPAVSIALPMVIILARLGLFDKPSGLSIVYSVGSIALTTWITSSIFVGIPVELEEAAQLFGASRIRTFFKVTFPLALPGLAAASMYAFLGAWNETVSAVILTQDNPTFALVVYQTLAESTGQLNLAAAGGLAMAVPSVIFTIIIKKYINQMWGGAQV